MHVFDPKIILFLMFTNVNTLRTSKLQKSKFFADENGKN